MAKGDDTLAAILIGIGAAIAAAALVGALASASSRSENLISARVRCPSCGSYYYIKTQARQRFVRSVCPFCHNYVNAEVR